MGYAPQSFKEWEKDPTRALRMAMLRLVIIRLLAIFFMAFVLYVLASRV